MPSVRLTWRAICLFEAFDGESRVFPLLRGQRGLDRAASRTRSEWFTSEPFACRFLEAKRDRKRIELTMAYDLHHRLARREDIPDLTALMEAAIAELQKPFLSPGQIASSRAIMGLDTQLIDDGTYFVVEAAGALAGCGGWSRRATLYGGDRSPGRDAALLDPAKDPARVRAMYTHPAYVRQGVGRLILLLCEEAARAEGFKQVELMATMAGEPLYRACGYEPVERTSDDRGGTAVPLLRMRKGF